MTSQDFSTAVLNDPGIQAAGSNAGLTPDQLGDHVNQLSNKGWFKQLLKAAGKELIKDVLPLFISLLTKKINNQ